MILTGYIMFKAGREFGGQQELPLVALNTMIFLEFYTGSEQDL